MDTKLLVELGWHWRPFSYGGVLTLGPVEVWVPDGIVKVNDKEVTKLLSTEDVVALQDALKLTDVSVPHTQGV